MQESTVAITGVAGLLGSHLADRFLLDGWQVIGIDNLTGGYEDNIPKNITFFKEDCNNFERVRQIFELYRPQVVIHAACTAYEGLSVFSPSFIFDNTASATVAVMSASVASRVKRFVFCSSMARYGDHQDRIFTEEMETKPQDPYGIAKVSAENVVSNLAKIHGMEHVILVPHNIIGPRQKYDDPYRNVASIMINRMLQGKAPVIYGDGTQTRSFSFISDVVEPIYLASTLKGVTGEIINVGPDNNEITIKELAVIIANKLGYSGNPIFVPDRPQEVKHASCSADKAKRMLNYQAKTSLESGLSNMIDYIRERGPLPFSYQYDLEILNDKTPETWSKKMI